MNRYRITTRVKDSCGAEFAFSVDEAAECCKDAMLAVHEKANALGLNVLRTGADLLGPAPPPVGTFYERQLTDKSRVFVNTVGEPGPGGAHVKYDLTTSSKDKAPGFFCTAMVFQHGNPDEEINGITNEQLLAIVRHRLQGFQSGPFPCEENAEAGKHVDAALKALERRADERLARGVSGEQTP